MQNCFIITNITKIAWANLRFSRTLSSGHLHAILGLDSLLFSEILIRKSIKETSLRSYGRISFYVIVNDPKGGSEVMARLTEKGRDEIINLSYSGKEKRELKRLVKRIDSLPKNR
jgi:hypothetical protein